MSNDHVVFNTLLDRMKERRSLSETSASEYAMQYVKTNAPEDRLKSQEATKIAGVWTEAMELVHKARSGRL